MRMSMALVAVAFLTLVGCKSEEKKDDTKDVKEEKKDPSPHEKKEEAPAESEAIKSMVKIADEMCACADAMCAAKVLETNAQAIASLQGFQPSSQAEGDRMMVESQRMSDCATKIPQ